MRAFVLSVSLLAASASIAGSSDEPEPPAGAADLRKLKGTWKAVRLVVKGKDMKLSVPLTYTFDGAKLTRTSGQVTMTLTMTLDGKKRPPVWVLTPDKGGLVQKVAFEEKNGELLMEVSARESDPVRKFDGKESPLFVLAREKK